MEESRKWFSLNDLNEIDFVRAYCYGGFQKKYKDEKVKIQNQVLCQTGHLPRKGSAFPAETDWKEHRKLTTLIQT